ncbi:MAG TPA: PQQ-binding-like beta-propeller repeat protein [Pirellulaceae bacterium]|nr:PQQ-binding-like beta-propeller repeat protein [Pirellulaceae bacterium]
MHSGRIYLALALVGWLGTAAHGENASTAAAEVNWGQWRGPLGTGVAPKADPPVLWNEAEGTNIRWKTRIPGRGHSTPVVWADRIFLTTAIPFGEKLPPRPSTAPGNHDNLPVTHRQQFVALALDRAGGKILWQKTLHEALPQEQGHHTASLASNSPVTDGERGHAFFGSFGLYCLDLDGKLIWNADFGPMQSLHGHGEGSSPVLHGQTLIVNWDHEGQSFVVALDKRTGKQKWKIERDEVTSWATPIIIEHAGKPQLIISGTSRIRGYDLDTGKVIWECGGLSSNIVASPVSDGRMVFAGSSYDKRALLAIHLDGASGDITHSDRIAWSRFRGTPYVPSPLLFDGGLYYLTHYQGILTRVDSASGEDRPGAIRLDGIKNIYSSPVAAAGRIYVTDLEGTTLVLSGGEVPRPLSLNHLSEPVSASAAIAGKELYLRGEKHLYCLAEPTP